MPKDPQEFADLLGAKIVGEVPDVGSGPFGMARLAHLMHQRLTPSRGQRPGRPTDSAWHNRPKVPMTEATQQRLAEIAAVMSTPERRVSPMQVAAQLLEEAVLRVDLPTEAQSDGGDAKPGDLASLKKRESQSGQETGPQERPNHKGTGGRQQKKRSRRGHTEVRQRRDKA
jgi:hypothetical protein